MKIDYVRINNRYHDVSYEILKPRKSCINGNGSNDWKVSSVLAYAAFEEEKSKMS